jgi:hypothetical protein
MYLINPFPLNVQIKALLFNTGTSQNPTVRIFQDLAKLTKLESDKLDNVNPYYQELLDKHITLNGRELQVASLTLLGQNEYSLTNFILKMAEIRFKMTTGGNNNIDPALLKKITKNAKNKQQ